MLLIESKADVDVRRDVVKLVNQIIHHTRGKSFPDAETGQIELTGYAPGDGRQETAKFDYKTISLGGDLQLPGLKVQYSELRVGVIYVDGRIMFVPYQGEFRLMGPHNIPIVFVVSQHIPGNFDYKQPRFKPAIKRYREMSYGLPWYDIDDVDFHTVFKEMSDLIVHEFTHAIDYLSKSRKGWGLRTRTFKPGKEPTEKKPTKLKPDEQFAREAYLKNEAELNAHLFEFFFKLILKFKKKYRKQSKENADLFAPKFQDLWELFLEEIPESYYDFLDEKFIMKKYLKRLHSMWEAYRSKLPDR